MRERLIVAFLGLTLISTALLGVTRAYFLADLVTTEQNATLQRTATLVATSIQEHLAAQQPVTTSYLTRYTGPDEGIQYRTPTTTVTAGLAIDTPDVLATTRTLTNGSHLTVVRSRGAIDRAITNAVMPLVITGLLLMALAAVMAFTLARRLSRPFQELAHSATILGSGRFDEVHIKHYRVPEAENIGTALRLSAQRLSTILQREREFSANASHQLRTPVTAMRLQLEDLALWPETPPTVAAELDTAVDELDRLSTAITHFLDLARGRHHQSTETDITAHTTHTAARWRAQELAGNRTITVTTTAPTHLRTDPDALDQILDILIDNAIKHGRGTITITTHTTPGWLILSVRDEGTSHLTDQAFTRGRSDTGSTGLGLALATDICHRLGGHLKLGPGPTTCLEAHLPTPQNP